MNPTPALDALSRLRFGLELLTDLQDHRDESGDAFDAILLRMEEAITTLTHAITIAHEVEGPPTANADADAPPPAQAHQSDPVLDYSFSTTMVPGCESFSVLTTVTDEYLQVGPHGNPTLCPFALAINHSLRLLPPAHPAKGLTAYVNQARVHLAPPNGLMRYAAEVPTFVSRAIMQYDDSAGTVAPEVPFTFTLEFKRCG